MFNFPYNQSSPELEAWLASQFVAFRTSGGILNPLPVRSAVKTTTGGRGYDQAGIRMTKVRRRRSAAIAFAVFVSALFLWILSRSRPDSGGPEALPHVFLWAWERPEDLRFLEGQNVGVAFLAGTISLCGGDLEVMPRRQPLLLAEGTILAAVVRIESGAAACPPPSNNQAHRTAHAILSLGASPRAAIIQLDFDAALSERDFYRLVLENLRRRMPAGRLLSMTAPASWCSGDPWIEGLPVDEIVPMLFQMGPDAPHIRRELARNGAFRVEACRTAIGLSTGEPWQPKISTRRRYIFSPSPWSQAQGARVVREAMEPP